MNLPALSRRRFLTYSAILPWALDVSAAPSIPVGLELYSVREELKRDLLATVRAVASMGYQGVEFYAPYFDWSATQTKEMRKLLDDLGMRCFSTHNSSSYFDRENLAKARDFNLILGSKYVVMASAQPKPGEDGWKVVAETLNFAAEQLEPAGLKAGYHNHKLEFTPMANQATNVRPIEIVAENTKPTIMLQLDVGTCLEAGSDPVAWIRANPGGFTPCTARIGRRSRRRDIPFCLAKVLRTGKVFSRPRRARAAWNITLSSRKEAGFRNWIRLGSVWWSFARGIRTDHLCAALWGKVHENSAHYCRMKNITLSADEQLIEQARLLAKSQHKTLNALFREWLERLTAEAGDTQEFDALMKRLKHVQAGRRFSRDEMPMQRSLQ